MIFHLLKKQSHMSLFMFFNRCKIQFCDWMGWTRVYDYPETKSMIAHSERHGRKCSGSPNCSNMNCINDSIPKWFKVLTRWDSL